MTKDEVREFFDRLAPYWDAEMIRNEDAIRRILDNGGIGPGVHVLDVACGTGVLFGDYLARDVADVVGVDISPEMVRIAKENCSDPRVRVYCADVEEFQTDQLFDCCMVYNAFPHFPDPEKLIAALAALVVPGGRLSIAHGMSREQIHEHHSGEAVRVSRDLPEIQQLAELFAPWFDVDIQISDDEMYQVSGVKR